MIRLLTKDDQQAVLEYLYQEPQINIFIIGDIENFGFDKEFQEVYANIENGIYQSVLLRYRENVIYYSHKTVFDTDYLEIMKTMNYRFISGKKSLTDLIHPFVPDMIEKPMYFCEATTIGSEFDINTSKVEKATSKEEFGKVFDLLIQITEFSGLQNTTREQYISNHMENKTDSLVLMIQDQNKVVATCATVADTLKSAMVVAVATDPNYRNQGLASSCMVALMKEYIENRNKSLCLFFDNPKAGKIYHRLGFKDMDMWTMLVGE